MLPIQVAADFKIIAHRGASAYAPENTVPAFALAQAMGIGDVEVDAQLTSDGVVVLCHDETLARYGHGERVVEQLASDTLLGLDMGSWFSPYFFKGTSFLTLEGLLAEFGSDFVFHIELKGKAVDLAAAVYAVVSAMDCWERVVFTSFSYEQLTRMRGLAEHGRLGWLVQDFDEEILTKARQLKLFQLCPKASNTNEKMVRRGRAAAADIRAWGVNGTPQQIKALIRQVVAAGCDGMTINWPDWVVRRAQ